jgi:hypothetical protein
MRRPIVILSGRTDNHAAKRLIRLTWISAPEKTHVTSKLAADTASFMQCMLGRNWRWVNTRVVQTRSAAPQQGFGSDQLKPVRVYPDPDAEGPPGGISWTECSNF